MKVFLNVVFKAIYAGSGLNVIGVFVLKVVLEFFDGSQFLCLLVTLILFLKWVKNLSTGVFRKLQMHFQRKKEKQIY